MKKLFIPYELALLAKEKGFDEPCFAYWNDSILLYQFPKNSWHGYEDIEQINFNVDEEDIAAPLYQQIIDWFDQKGIDIEKPKLTVLGYLPHVYQNESCKWQGDYCDTKYQAYNKAIEEAFKLI